MPVFEGREGEREGSYQFGGKEKGEGRDDARRNAPGKVSPRRRAASTRARKRRRRMKDRVAMAEVGGEHIGRQVSGSEGSVEREG